MDSSHAENGDINLSPNGSSLRDGYADKTNISLPYHVIRDHKKNWAIWFSCFLFDGCILPIILFYVLWFHTSLTHWWIFAIITSLSFWTSYHKWFSRGWRLLKKDPKYRPLNSTGKYSRFYFDCSYYILTIALGVMILELVIATGTKNVKVRVIAMAPPSVLYTIAVYCLIQNTMHVLRIRTPVRLSSTTRGSLTPPPLVTVMEDVFAVDGCHIGYTSREAVLATYKGSETFRRTLMLWSWIWCISCAVVAVVLSIIVGVTSETTCFAICYAVSYPFIALLTVITAIYMDRQDQKGAFTVSTADGTQVMEGT